MATGRAYRTPMLFGYPVTGISEDQLSDTCGLMPAGRHGITGLLTELPTTASIISEDRFILLDLYKATSARRCLIPTIARSFPTGLLPAVHHKIMSETPIQQETIRTLPHALQRT